MKYKKSEQFMSMLEVGDLLGRQIRATMRDDLTAEEREETNAKSRFMIGLANQYINAANFTLNAEKLLAENGDLDKSLIKEWAVGDDE